MTVAIFFKDVRILGRQILGLSVLTAFSIAFIGILQQASAHMGSPFNVRTLVAAQLLFCGLFALIAAGLVFADEEQDGTDILLKRLPVAPLRLVSEKLGAGLVCLTAIWAVVAMSHVALDINDNFTDSPRAIGTVTGNFTIMLYSSYVIGVGLSLVLNRTIMIVMLGVLLQSSGWYLADVFVSDLPLSRTGILVLLFAAVLMLGPFAATRAGLHPPLIHFDRRPFPNLVFKALSDTSFAIIGAVLVLILTLIAYPTTRTGADVLDLTLVAVMGILAAAAGISGYRDSDADGLNGLLYHHPVSRRSLLLSKFSAAAIPLALLSASTTLATAHYADFSIGISALLAATIYILAVSATLGFRSERNAILAAIAIFGALAGWTFVWAQPGSEWLWFDGFPDGYAGMTMSGVVAVPIAFYFMGMTLFTCLAATNRRFLASATSTRYTLYGIANVAAAILMIVATIFWRAAMGI